MCPNKNPTLPIKPFWGVCNVFGQKEYIKLHTILSANKIQSEKTVNFLRSVFVSERNVVVLSVSILLILIPLSAWWNVLPLYFEDLGASQVEIGLIYSLINITSYGLQLPGGLLADRYGRRLLIALPTFSFIFCYFVAGVAWAWPIAAVAIIVANFFSGIQGPAFTSIIAESVEDKKQGTAFGMFEFFIDLGFVIGPLIGAMLIPFYGYTMFFYATGLVSGFSAFIRLVFLRETLPEKMQKSGRKFVLPKFDKNFLFFLFGCCLFSFTGGLLMPIMARYAQDIIGLSFSQIELMFSVSMVAMLIASIPCGKCIERIGAKKCLGIAFLVADLTVGLWAYSWSFEVALLIMSFSSAFVTLNYVGYNALISQLTVPETRGMAIGFSSLMLGVSAGVGSFVGPLLWVDLAPATPFLLTAVVCIPAALLLIKVDTAQKIG